MPHRLIVFLEHLELVLRRTFYWFCFETIDVSIQEPSAHHHFPAKSHPCRREGRRVGWLDQENQLSGITPLNAKIKAVHPERDSKKGKRSENVILILKSPEIKHSFSGSSGRFWYKNQVASLQFKKKNNAFLGASEFRNELSKICGFFFGASSCC